MCFCAPRGINRERKRERGRERGREGERGRERTRKRERELVLPLRSRRGRGPLRAPRRRPLRGSLPRGGRQRRRRRILLLFLLLSLSCRRRRRRARSREGPWKKKKTHFSSKKLSFLFPLSLKTGPAHAAPPEPPRGPPRRHAQAPLQLRAPGRARGAVPEHVDRRTRGSGGSGRGRGGLRQQRRRRRRRDKQQLDGRSAKDYLCAPRRRRHAVRGQLGAHRLPLLRRACSAGAVLGLSGGGRGADRALEHAGGLGRGGGRGNLRKRGPGARSTEEEKGEEEQSSERASVPSSSSFLFFLFFSPSPAPPQARLRALSGDADVPFSGRRGPFR